LAWVAALANPLDVWIKMLLAAAIVASLVLTLRNMDAMQSLRLHPDGDWEIIRRTGPPLTGRLEPSTIVTPWMVILHLKTPAGRLAIPICRDGVDPESFRRLRVYLRISATSATQPRKNNPTT